MTVPVVRPWGVVASQAAAMTVPTRSRPRDTFRGVFSSSCRTACVSAAIVLAAPVARAQVCDGSAALEASRDLYCMTLVPAPGFDSASGHVRARQNPRSIHRNRHRGRSASLRASRNGGRTTHAQLTRSVHDVCRVGDDADDVSDAQARHDRKWAGALGRIDFDPFIILITAESSAAVRAPTGRVVLRGGSPSTRLPAAGPSAVLRRGDTRVDQHACGGGQSHGRDDDRHEAPRAARPGGAARFGALDNRANDRDEHAAR